MVSYVTKGEEIDGETKWEREREKRENEQRHKRKNTHAHVHAGSCQYCTDKKTD